jgi:hypothetical protein
LLSKTYKILIFVFQFKISVLAIGTCFVILVYGILWDAGEFSWIARQYQFVQSLKREGFNCTTEIYNFNYSGHAYTIQECHCERNKEISKYSMSAFHNVMHSTSLQTLWEIIAATLLHAWKRTVCNKLLQVYSQAVDKLCSHCWFPVCCNTFETSC